LELLKKQHVCLCIKLEKRCNLAEITLWMVLFMLMNLF
jgi:hypothetical protein